MSDDLVKLALEAGRAAARIEALEKELATCRKYRDAYAEMDRIGTQAVRNLTAERDALAEENERLRKRVEAAERLVEMAWMYRDKYGHRALVKEAEAYRATEGQT